MTDSPLAPVAWFSRLSTSVLRSPPPVDVPSLFARLPQHLSDHGIVPLEGVYQFDVANEGRWTVSQDGGSLAIARGFTRPELGHLALTPEALFGIVGGEIDPVALLRAGGLVHHGAEETHFLTLLLQCFNARHLEPSLRDHALGRFYRTGTCEDASGDPVVVGGWSIPASVGQMLNRLVLREGLGRTLEIGLAYGISALHLCEAHRARGTGMHTAIDPWQTRTFRDIGRLNVERSGLMPWFEFLDAPDWLALPRLLERGVRIDLAFIDGLHLFDTTLLDFFYCDLILRPGGYLIFDDCTFPGVEGVIEFVLANRAYELIEEHHHRVSVLRKTADDDRAEQDVAFHRPF